MTHIVLANAGGEIRELELDDVILMFFDTLMATLNAAFQGHPGTPFDFFEYEDVDGERLSVRTDEELQTFLVELLQMGQNLPKIHLKSSRALMRQQISFDESDDLIMASQCAGSSAENGPIIASSDIGNGNSPTTIKAISPEDLQLVERLSDGQFGTVYKALDVKYDRLLAVKCISVDDTSGTRQVLLNEIAILKRSSHPNIVIFHAALFVENQLLIIMELMDALSLDLYGQLPPPVLGAVTVGVVEGLAHLWSRSIMHRDIKPSNFLVNTAGEVKLGDFGVSKQMALSVAWSYVGTKVYMAPERVDGEVYNVASDVWSLGVALAEMGLGKFPFQAEVGATNATVDSLLYSQARIATLLAEPALIAVGNGFVALLTACLALKPHQRIGPEAIVASQFLNTHRPMNKDAIVKFIAEKRQWMPNSQNSKPT